VGADPSDRQEFLLVTGDERAAPSAGVIIVCTALLVAVTVAVVRLRSLPGAAGLRAVGVGTLIATTTVWILARRIERLAARRLRLHRPGPAMRLSAAGLDYSAAFTGDLPVHVDWAQVLSCRRRPGPGGGRFWCLFASAVQGLGPLPSSLDRRSIVGPDRCRARARGQSQASLAFGVPPGDLDLLTHLLAFGTPIAIDLALVEGVPWREVDTRVQEWTHGRCRLRRCRSS
jgi:hypothetical protein